jgi:hypothetical protein
VSFSHLLLLDHPLCVLLGRQLVQLAEYLLHEAACLGEVLKDPDWPVIEQPVPQLRLRFTACSTLLLDLQQLVLEVLQS